MTGELSKQNDGLVEDQEMELEAKVVVEATTAANLEGNEATDSASLPKAGEPFSSISAAIVVAVPETYGEDAEIFKIPEVPIASTSAFLDTERSPELTTDIEHILSVGANVGDDTTNSKTSNFDQVVRDLRLNHGFATTTTTTEVEQEMHNRGVKRVLKAEDSDMAMDDEDDKKEKEAEKNGDSPSSSSSEESSSDSVSSSSTTSDSDDDDDETIAAALHPNATVVRRTTPRSRNRKRPGKQRQRATSMGSDLSENDVNAEGGASSSSAPRTEHELVQPEVSLPDILRLPESVEVVPFGKVESLIETVVVIKADVSGDWRVLDEGTVTCWQDRTVAGSIFETMGSVQQPYYVLRFPSTALPDPAVFTIGKALFYAPSMATFVFTREIRAFKGSDASNLYDEEVGHAEMEFSDDEKEMAYKQSLKANRRARTASAAPRGNSRAPSETTSSKGKSSHGLPQRPTLSYADADGGDYKPFERSKNLHMSSASIGEIPPLAAAGRRMFERDTGQKVMGGQKGQDNPEFAFSDNEEDETGSVSSTLEMDDPAANVYRVPSSPRDIVHSNTTRGRGRGRGGSERGRGRGRGRGEKGSVGQGGSDGRGESARKTQPYQTSTRDTLTPDSSAPASYRPVAPLRHSATEVRPVDSFPPRPNDPYLPRPSQPYPPAALSHGSIAFSNSAQYASQIYPNQQYTNQQYPNQQYNNQQHANYQQPNQPYPAQPYMPQPYTSRPPAPIIEPVRRMHPGNYSAPSQYGGMFDMTPSYGYYPTPAAAAGPNWRYPHSSWTDPSTPIFQQHVLPTPATTPAPSPYARTGPPQTSRITPSLHHAGRSSSTGTQRTPYSGNQSVRFDGRSNVQTRPPNAETYTTKTADGQFNPRALIGNPIAGGVPPAREPQYDPNAPAMPHVAYTAGDSRK